MSQLIPSFGPLELNAHYKIGIISTLWNEDYANSLVDGALKIQANFPTVNSELIKVAGAIELTYAANQLCSKFDALIVFGAVVKGETPHFDYVCQSVTQGITYLNATQSTPIIFGVLTVLNHAQIIDRLGGKHGHKGEEAMLSAIQMLSLNLGASKS